MTDSLFVGVSKSLNTSYIQYWAGDILDNMIYVDSYEELAQFSNKIIIIESCEANHNFELTKKLLQQNYLIFCNFYECVDSDSNFKSLYADLLHDFTNYAVLGNSNSSFGRLFTNLNEFYFATANEPNRLRMLRTTDKIFSTHNKPFKFLYLNGKSRQHRIELWKKLENNNTLPLSLHSWLDSISFAEHSIPVTLLPFEYDSPFTNGGIVHLYKEDWPRYRQLKKDFWRNHWIDGHIVPSQYINTYFTVVTKTTVDGDPFLTEKIFKPILAGHPFIALASAGFYDALHNLGFKTFSPYIDESFDHEENIHTRLTLIADQIKQLCSSDLDAFLNKTKEICLYNQHHYINSQWDLWYKVHQNLKNMLQQTIIKLPQTL